MVGIGNIMTSNIPFGLVHDGKRGQGVAEYVNQAPYAMLMVLPLRGHWPT